MINQYDYCIVGSGIMGLTLAYTIKQNKPQARIIILEKEAGEARHASGRNSGVLHAGFYYTADSLKAKFTLQGNKAMRQFCKENGLKINTCGKLVVANDEKELALLFELHKRGKANGSNVFMIDAVQALEMEPNVKTFKKALHSPDTASVDPSEICACLREKLSAQDVIFVFEDIFLDYKNGNVITDKREIVASHLINCAGLYADKIAQRLGFGQKYVMIPFKGLYLKYTKNKTDIKMNIYPVPNLKNPFLGVHFTKTVDGTIKIGPTATPAFWRENYQGFDNFQISELLQTGFYETKLFLTNAFGFRELAIEETKKYYKKYFISLAQKMVRTIDPKGFTEFTKPGIRAQLMNKSTMSLVQDFIVEGDQKSTHILNAVSPAFTCSFPFSKYIYDKYLHHIV